MGEVLYIVTGKPTRKPCKPKGFTWCKMPDKPLDWFRGYKTIEKAEVFAKGKEIKELLVD